jgi:hypothetical protein
MGMRKHQAIDLIKLYSSCDHSHWNIFLHNCYLKRDIQKLARTRYQLQAGMSDLSKKKLNTEKMINWFLRLQTSIEKTIKKILREKNPNPCDNSLIASDHAEFKVDKNKRDHELELFFKKSGY